MPFGIHKHSNRSKQALNDSSSAGQVSAQTLNTDASASSSTSNFAASGTADEPQPKAPAPAPQVQAFNQQPRADDNPYIVPQGPGVGFEQRTYQYSGDLPARSQSTRYPSASTPPLSHGFNSSADDLTLEARRYQQQGRGIPAPAVEQKKSKSIFDRMRSGRTAEQKTPPTTPTQSSYNNTTGLTRRLSKRPENIPVIHTTHQRTALDQQQRGDWRQSAQNSRSHLPSPQEGNEDEGELDPYLIQDPDQTDPRNLGQGLGLQQSIRPVQSDSDQPPQLHIPQDDERHYTQQQQSSSPIQYQTREAFQQGYQQQEQRYPQQSIDTRPTSLLIDSQFGQQSTDTVSQLSHDSPVEQREDQRPISVQSNSNGPSPTSGYTQLRQDLPTRITSIQAQGPRPLSQHTAMAPPSGASSQSRRSADPKQTPQNATGQGESRDGPPPSYQQQFPRAPSATPGASPLPPSSGQQGTNFRASHTQRDQYGLTAGGDQGRSTPPLAPGERDVNEAYKEILQKYKKVKSLYFDKTAQVEQLQNSLANQRLSQSRTSLDDSEYMTRFQRLDGATTNLAFNIRKDWRTVPPWLVHSVNQDALKIGKQEMTGVGRACITRFLIEEIFNKTFHPGLEGELSLSLKAIEQNIRRFSPTLNNQEESDALTAKVVQWRLATLDGLKDVLNSPESEEYRAQFARIATTNLTASLLNFLSEPAPPGIEDSAHMIVELAVSIASNLPLESRDIAIIYPMPGDLLQPYIMKVEGGIPALENPGAETSSEVDASSTGSGDKDDGGASKESEKADAKVARKEKTKSTGILQAMMGGGGSSSATTASKKTAASPSAETSAEGKSKASTADDGAQKVRFAGFMGIEVRGRQILSKAPVWTVGGS